MVTALVETAILIAEWVPCSPRTVNVLEQMLGWPGERRACLSLQGSTLYQSSVLVWEPWVSWCKEMPLFLNHHKIQKLDRLHCTGKNSDVRQAESCLLAHGPAMAFPALVTVLSTVHAGLSLPASSPGSPAQAWGLRGFLTVADGREQAVGSRGRKGWGERAGRDPRPARQPAAQS